MTQKSQGEPRYQVPRQLADSLAFRSLPVAAKVLWHDLMMQYRGGNNGNINAVLSELAHYNWRSSTTIAKGLRFLIAHGLIKETRMGGKRAGNLKQCCLYAFTHLPIHANAKLNIQGKEATHDYRNFDHNKNVVAANLSLQKMERVAPHNAACRST
ncbi:MAG: hypothetical protein K8R50_10355 [Betaproteobacteria bacterium]|nr:hypothetical protein [Betaproteobacteria bacterium]